MEYNKYSIDNVHKRNCIAYMSKKNSLTRGWWALFTDGIFIYQKESKDELICVTDHNHCNYIVQVD